MFNNRTSGEDLVPKMHLSPHPLPSSLGFYPFLGGDFVVFDSLFNNIALIVKVLCLLFPIFVISSFAIILMGKKELVALLCLSFLC